MPVDNLSLCLVGCELICGLATVGYLLCLAICTLSCFAIQEEQP